MMKVIFVASGNKAVGQVNSFVRSQFDSLEKAGLDMRLFPVVGHGVWAHLRAVWNLRQLIRREHPQIIHAHYSICGYVAWLASIGLCHRPRIIVSILGSFPTHDVKWRIVRFCIQHLWDATLVKSERTRAQLNLDLPIIPNGVSTGIFYPVSESEREIVRLRLFRERISDRERESESEKSQFTNNQSQITNTKYIIWCSNPERIEKNWALAQEVVKILRESERESEKSQITNNKSQIELIAVYNKMPQEVAAYMNAADCLLLTSMSEGSPNVIKEAMACNCPIVTTDVGDVPERLDGLSGCFVIPTDDTPIYGLQGVGEWFEKDAQYLAEALRKALDFGQRTKGYERIIQDGLTIELTAKKIINIYNKF